MRLGVLAVACLAGFGCGVTGEAQAAKRALLIGIDRYGDPSIPDLAGAKNDVSKMQRFLEQHLGFADDEIALLLDGNATAAAIPDMIESWLIDGTTAGDDVLLYYSGHGFQQPDDGAGEEDDGLDETLVAADAHPDGAGGFANMVSDDQLAELLERLADRRVTAIIDSCHSGTATRAVVPTLGRGTKSPPLPPGATPVPSARSLAQDGVASRHRGERGFALEEIAGDPEAQPWRVTWSAVSPAQLAFEDDEAETPGGVFTNGFLAGLEGEADANGDGSIARIELLDYVRERSEAFCRRKGPACTLGITPVLEAPRGLLAGTALTSAGAATGWAPVAGAWEPDPAPASDVLLGALLGDTNEAGLELTVEPGPDLRSGDEVRFRMRSERAGRVILLDLNADLELRQLFPNVHAPGRDVDLAPGRALVVPGDDYGLTFEAGPPFGSGVVFALLIEDAIALDELESRHPDFAVIDTPQRYLNDLAGLLRTTWTADTVNRAIRWSVARTGYQIGP